MRVAFGVSASRSFGKTPIFANRRQEREGDPFGIALRRIRKNRWLRWHSTTNTDARFKSRFERTPA
jgi:hypothetical protein